MSFNYIKASGALPTVIITRTESQWVLGGPCIVVPKLENKNSIIVLLRPLDVKNHSRRIMGISLGHPQLTFISYVYFNIDPFISNVPQKL